MHTNIGVRLKEIRKKNKLKQTQMAEIAHCSLRNYQNIESAKHSLAMAFYITSCTICRWIPAICLP